MCRPVLFSILTQKIKESIIRHIVPGSSMVEQEAVNFEVAGSSPAPGARIRRMPKGHYFYSGKYLSVPILSIIS